MELFLDILDNIIIDIHTERTKESNIKVNFNDMDEFYTTIESYDNIEEELEQRVSQLLDSTAEKRSLSSFNIKHWVSNRSFGELIDMYETNEIIKPDMQREFVWDSLKCSRLIESIIMGLPIPPLFLLEVSKNQYELIDGYQRLTTVFNFVKGNPWHGKSETGRNIKAKLSSKVSDELQGKTFDNLSAEYKRAIKRSTIPLIEFKQLEPDSLSSKYLIFERINTGSEKLNSMQIRKSLAHGTFIKELYKLANDNKLFLDLFSRSNIKKDQHVEAYLRVKVMSEIYYKTYETDKAGINNILNEYCENNRELKFDLKFIDLFDSALEFTSHVFEESKDMFRRVETINGINQFAGNLNTSIMEAFLGVLINTDSEDLKSPESVHADYLTIMAKIREESLSQGKTNPFTTSTGAKESIVQRFEICEEILRK